MIEYIDAQNELCTKCMKLPLRTMCCSGLRLDDEGNIVPCQKLITNRTKPVPTFKAQSEYSPVLVEGFTVERRTRDSVGIMYSSYANACAKPELGTTLCFSLADPNVIRYTWEEQVETIRKVLAYAVVFIDKVDAVEWHEEQRERLYAALRKRRIFNRPTYVTYVLKMPEQIGYDNKQ